MHRFPSILVLLAFSCLASSAERPNVLFIAVDDLRPELACYGKQHIHSPNIDRLAKSGALFERAYCMVPTCGASRASLMTGIRPTPKRFITYSTRADREAPGVLPLNTHFKQQGYHTVSLGKIYHNPEDHAEGWSEKPWRPGSSMSWQLPENQAILARNKATPGRPDRGPPFELSDVPEQQYPDGQVTQRAIRALGRISQKKKPFFLAVGFFKPHLPFNAPKKYWDLYDRKKIQLPDNYHPPKDAPPGSIHSSGELRAYEGVPRKGPVSDEMARSLIHGYYACVSFTDAQVGRVLDELKRLNLEDNTIVVLWGDHGWNLGEHTLWCKHSPFETSMHAPLIIRAPGQAKAMRSRSLVEFIDLYPTLCELSGLEKPKHLEGESLLPELGKSDAVRTKTWAVGRFGGADTLRTDRFRFSEYRQNRGAGALTGEMLYDHQEDPGENVNVVKDQADAAEQLRKQLHRRKGK